MVRGRDGMDSTTQSRDQRQASSGQNCVCWYAAPSGMVSMSDEVPQKERMEAIEDHVVVATSNDSRKMDDQA